MFGKLFYQFRWLEEKMCWRCGILPSFVWKSIFAIFSVYGRKLRNFLMQISVIMVLGFSHFFTPKACVER
jgi:hypothetical protein